MPTDSPIHRSLGIPDSIGPEHALGVVDFLLGRGDLIYLVLIESGFGRKSLPSIIRHSFGVPSQQITTSWASSILPVAEAACGSY